MGEQPPVNQGEIGEISQTNREAEIVANQKFLKRYGFEISDEDVRKLIESIPQNSIDELSGPEKHKIGYLVIPAIKIPDLISKIEDDDRWIVTFEDISAEEMDLIAPRSEQNYAIAFPLPRGDEETQESVTDWETSGKTYMNLYERLILVLKATHIWGDDRWNLLNWRTICPGKIDTYVSPNVPGYSDFHFSCRVYKYPDPFLEPGEIGPCEIVTNLE
jgi:hypothetical protein